MKFQLSCLVLGLTLAACAADATDDPADAEEAQASQDELSANAAKLAGAFTVKSGGAVPTFDGLVLEQDGTFFADVDTGIRCFRAPCPSNARITGKFTATKSYLRLSPNKGEQATEYHGRYDYKLSNSTLSLSRDNHGFAWSEKLSKENSYCAEASDCEHQGIIHPMCAGSWTCGSATSHSCGYKCGIPAPEALFPANATQLVASSPGGGFVAPPPAGSACTIGRQKYTYDIAAKTIAWEKCQAPSAGQPFQIVTGTSNVTAAEARAINDAATGMTLSAGDICGADKPFLSVQVTSPSGTKSLYDSFYSCQGGDKIYVDGIDAVFAALRDASN